MRRREARAAPSRDSETAEAERQDLGEQLFMAAVHQRGEDPNDASGAKVGSVLISRKTGRPASSHLKSAREVATAECVVGADRERRELRFERGVERSGNHVRERRPASPRRGCRCASGFERALQHRRARGGSLPIT
jgi:hypothetical protein